MKNATAEVIAFSEPAISVTPVLSLTEAVNAAFADAREYKGKLNEYVLSIQGMSGRKFRYFLNNVIANVSNPRYLEIGSWAGSTFCSAILGNTVKATAIDNWSLFGGPVQHFFANLANCGGLNARTSVLFEDFRKVDYKALGKFNVYLFDGPHAYQDQYDALSYAWDALTDEFVFICDDWNWPAVRAGTLDAVRELGLEVLTQIEVRTTDDDTTPEATGGESDWHNGYYIAVLRKNGAAGPA
jgi:SAM-dependent methyltransferase